MLFFPIWSLFFWFLIFTFISFVKVLLVFNFIFQLKFMLSYFFQFSSHSFDFLFLSLKFFFFNLTLQFNFFLMPSNLFFYFYFHPHFFNYIFYVVNFFPDYILWCLTCSGLGFMIFPFDMLPNLMIQVTSFKCQYGWKFFFSSFSFMILSFFIIIFWKRKGFVVTFNFFLIGLSWSYYLDQKFCKFF